MDARIKKDVIAIFSMLMKQHCPDFKKTKGFGSAVIFARKVDDQLTQLVGFLIDPSGYNKFTLEVGWLFNATVDDIGSSFDPEEALNEKAPMLRLGCFADKVDLWNQSLVNSTAFYRERMDADVWWRCPYRNDNEDLEPEVRCRKSPNFPIISEAFELLRVAGMPYLERAAEFKRARSSKQRTQGIRSK